MFDLRRRRQSRILYGIDTDPLLHFRAGTGCAAHERRGCLVSIWRRRTRVRVCPLVQYPLTATLRASHYSLWTIVSNIPLAATSHDAYILGSWVIVTVCALEGDGWVERAHLRVTDAVCLSLRVSSMSLY